MDEPHLPCRAPSNPFATRWVRPGQLPFLSTGNLHEGRSPVDSAYVQLRRNRWRGQIVGPHGSGKSTLLAALRRKLRQSGWQTEMVMIEEGALEKRDTPKNFLSDGPSEKAILLIDGFDQLRWGMRWRYRLRCRQSGKEPPFLSRTRHLMNMVLRQGRDRRRPASDNEEAFFHSTKRGLVVTTHRSMGMPTIFQTAPTPEVLEAIVEHLLSPKQRQTLGLSSEILRACFHRHRGNLRNVLFELYDRAEECHFTPMD